MARGEAGGRQGGGAALTQRGEQNYDVHADQDNDDDLQEVRVLGLRGRWQRGEGRGRQRGSAGRKNVLRRDCGGSKGQKQVHK